MTESDVPYGDGWYVPQNELFRIRPASDGEEITLRKNEPKPYLRGMSFIPTKASAEFGCCIKDVLKENHGYYDLPGPVACIDEPFEQLIGEVRKPLQPRSGRIKRCDNVYVRNGVARL